MWIDPQALPHQGYHKAVAERNLLHYRHARGMPDTTTGRKGTERVFGVFSARQLPWLGLVGQLYLEAKTRT